MPKHTPGPWRGNRGMGWIVSDSAEGITIDGAADDTATQYYGGNLIAESVSPNNMPLIAAAPDLLDACHAALAWLESINTGGIWDLAQQLRAAIAKAEGSTEGATNA